MAHYKDLTIDQGTDVSIELHLVNQDKSAKNLTGYSTAAKLAPNYNASDSDRISFDTQIASPATDGILTMSLTNLQTDTLQTKRKYVYDVEISFISDSDGMGGDILTIERVLEGNLFVKPSVTK
jgi:hypothetical protein